ncbi:MAG TPA: excinuclease ABC subunit UvrA, partial [Verrucomicrobiota bacterium]|nr:excinuclease ABC subunit UvrA [Verrucomicrobiota bacterium]
IRPWQSGFSTESHYDLINFCKKRGVPIDVPFEQLSPEQKKWVIEGDKDYGIDEDHSFPNLWYGIKGYFDWLEGRSYKMHVRVLLSRYRSYTTCPDCKGARFQPDVLLYKFEIDSTVAERLKREGKCSGNLITIAEFYLMPINDALEVVKSVRSKTKIKDKNPVVLALDEIVSRLEYLAKIGLGYLTLNRQSRTLSGGETERVNLTACLGSRLVNTLYILDEPSVGLHPRDTDKLISILKDLRDIGNTVVVVEHEPSVITSANQIVDLGPGSGESGGNLVFQGEFKQLLKHPTSLTSLYLSGRKQIPIPPRRPVKEIKNGELAAPVLTLSNATSHNLKNITVDIPLKRFVCITGVSGSGKSTLTRECLLPILQRRIFLKKTDGEPLVVNEDKDDEKDDSGYGDMMDVSGWELIDDVTLVDQSPLGKTPRSNPALYSGTFNFIRELFANSPSARSNNFTASSFSFNCAEGKCEKCNGAGYEKIEMQFLSDIYIKCPQCDGKRYKKEILEIKVSPYDTSYKSGSNKSLNIAEVLDCTVDEAIDWLNLFVGSKPAQKAVKMLGVLKKVGLGYIKLGQPVTTLSGGECQRLKLARCLAEVVEKQSRNRENITDEFTVPSSILFLFDEPTTGLHFDDVRVLLNAFNELVNEGHSVVVIEHNLEVIKCADWIIDLGPEAGDNGGKIVICGTPEDVANCPSSYTGIALKNILKKQ